MAIRRRPRRDDREGRLMPRGIAKRDLPVRTCARCGRPFTWRRKWARDWATVRYCSDACRRKGAADAASQAPRTSS